jgi:5-methyltetrahydropteroyltriglutamate--homocysteine methyltransferase
LVKLALQDQQNAGIDVVIGGLIRWNDAVSHLAGKVGGTRIDGLMRFFDTNFYVRQPVVQGKIEPSRPLVVNEFEGAAQRSASPAKPILMGPYTHTQLSLGDGEGGNPDALRQSYAEALGAEIRKEVEALIRAGCEIIQIDEPAISVRTNCRRR